MLYLSAVNLVRFSSKHMDPVLLNTKTQTLFLTSSSNTGRNFEIFRTSSLCVSPIFTIHRDQGTTLSHLRLVGVQTLESALGDFQLNNDYDLDSATLL